MKKNIVISGMGVVTPIGIGLDQFGSALKAGKTNFSICTFEQGEQQYTFPVAKLEAFNHKEQITNLALNESLIRQAKRMRNISTSTAYGLFCALEAWANAGLLDADIDHTRIAIVSSGSNTQQASIQTTYEKYRDKSHFINPYYGLQFFDSDIVGVLSDLLDVKGEGHQIGAASASGNVAIIQGCRLINTNEYDLVIVVAPMMDLSIYEYQAFTALGAMATAKEDSIANDICRPFDQSPNGFVYGQSAGCLILESETHAAKRGQHSYGSLLSYGISMDANRNPNPSAEGEQLAMRKAIENAGLDAGSIDYVNTHGTASPIGDKTEAEALVAAGLKGVKANSTKSLIGHALSAAGLVECIASLIQMQDGFLHPSHNLVHAISDEVDWVRGEAEAYKVQYAMSNSFGFGGINTAIVLKK